MRDDEFEYWIRYGQEVTSESVLLNGMNFGADLIALWNLFAEVGDRVRRLEDER